MSGQLPSTWWQIEGAYNQNASLELQELFGVSSFETAKPVGLLERILRISGDRDCTGIDFFAGSGTTGHAVINLNREDGGRRKLILVEMADYFDTVLLPRIKKVAFTPEWRDGKPKRMATAEEAERGPRIVKVLRLESYEDALNNIVFDESSGQQAMQFDDYLLRYMLKWEARKSETLLDIEKLAGPFRYKLHIHAGGRTSEKPMDIPETFAYLLGLHVQTRRVYQLPSSAGASAVASEPVTLSGSTGQRPSRQEASEGSAGSTRDASAQETGLSMTAESARAGSGDRYLVYRGLIDQPRIAVIWRETEGWGQADYERDRQFVTEQKLAEGADELFVNGDSLIPGARALEPLFKARMFAPVETG